MRKTAIALAALALSVPPLRGQVPEGAPLTYDNVLYTTPVWSRDDPFALLYLASRTNAIDSAASLGPRVTALEGGTGNWDTAFGWGNHAGLYRDIGWVPSWGDITDIPQDFPPSTHEHDYTAVTNPPWLTSFTEQDEIALQAIFTHSNNGSIHLSTEQAERIANAVTSETDETALAALAAHAAYWPPNATASSWFTFTTNAGAITITGYNIAGGTDVVIPEYINGWPVTVIGEGAFSNDGAGFPINSVIIPDSVISIGFRAFVKCASLTSVTIPDRIDTIEWKLFLGCSDLTNLIFTGNAPTLVYDEAFDGTHLDLVATVTDPQAAGWGTNLSAGGRSVPVVRLPLYAAAIYQDGQLAATTGDVAQAVFAHTNNETIHLSTEQAERIANAVTNEQDLAALRAYHYGSPDIVESPAEWFAFDGAGTITAFNWEAGRENVVIPWEIGGVPVTTIGEFAFSLDHIGYPVTSVRSPKTVVLCEKYSFGGCSELKSISFPGARILGASFDECSSLTNVSLPNAITLDGTFAYCSSLSTIVLPSVAFLGNGTFANCSAINSVSFSGPAPTIGEGIFYSIPANQVTNYVTNPQATGWGAKLGGMPVVRLPLYGSHVTAQAYTLGGDTITEWPEAITNGQPGPITLGSMTILANGNVGIGPTIGNAQLQIFTDGTNAYQADVNAATNLLVKSHLGSNGVSTVWKGSASSFESIGDIDSNTVYFVEDDGTTFNTQGIYRDLEIYNAIPIPYTTTVSLVENKTTYHVNVYTNMILAFGTNSLNITGKEVEFKLRLEVTETNIPSMEFVGMAFDVEPEILVTGIWEFAVSTVDGVKYRAKQTWPECDRWRETPCTMNQAYSVVNALFDAKVWATYTAIGVTNYLTYLLPANDSYLIRNRTYGSGPNIPPTYMEHLVLKRGHFHQTKTLIYTSTKLIKTYSGEATESYFVFPADPASKFFELALVTGEPFASSGSGSLYTDCTYVRRLNSNERAAYAAGWRP